jgi:hypothetical protein
MVLVKHTFIDIQCCDDDCKPVLRRQKSDPLFGYVGPDVEAVCASKWAEPLTPTTCDDQCFTPASLNEDNLTPTAYDEASTIDEEEINGKTFSFTDAVVGLHGNRNDAPVISPSEMDDFCGVYGLPHMLQAAGSWSSVWPEMCEASALLSTQQMLQSEYQWCGSHQQNTGDASSRIPMALSGPVQDRCNNYYTMQLDDAPQYANPGYYMPSEEAPELPPPPPPPPPPLPQDCQEWQSMHYAIKDEAEEASTTLMVRSLPEDLAQPTLVEQLIEGGYRGLFNFVYMPMNFRGHGNFGYAFVNFISHQIAIEFMALMQKVEHGDASTPQKWDIVWSTCQGLSANIERYRNSPLMHELVPKGCKPAVYDDMGNQVAFPQPTKTIPKPRIHWPGPKESKEAKSCCIKDHGDPQVEVRGRGDSQIGNQMPERRPGRSKNNQRQHAAGERRM